VRKSIDVDLALIDQYDTLIVDLELTVGVVDQAGLNPPFVEPR
jgi:hypothetical protein